MSDGPRTFMRKATIAASGTVSDALDCQGATLVAIEIPSSFTGATLTFQADIDGSGTFRAIVNTSGAAVTWTLGGADRVVCPVGADALISVNQLKVVSGSSEAAERVLKCHFLRTNA